MLSISYTVYGTNTFVCVSQTFHSAIWTVELQLLTQWCTEPSLILITRRMEDNSCPISELQCDELTPQVIR